MLSQRLLVEIIDVGDLETLRGCDPRLLVDRRGLHGSRQRTIAGGIGELVLGARDRGDDVAQDHRRVPEIAIVDQRKGRQNLFEHRDRVASVEERRVGRKSELVMVATDQIQAEGVEGADPELGRRLRRGRDQAFG